MPVPVGGAAIAIAAARSRRVRQVLVGLFLIVIMLGAGAVTGAAAVVGAVAAFTSNSSGSTSGCQPVAGSGVGTGHAVFPLPEGTWRMSSPYGMRLHPVKGLWLMHNGVDFAAADGTAMFSILEGEVDRVIYPPSGDNFVVVASSAPSGERIEITYMHMWRTGIFVAPGDRVLPGSLIGTVGNSGTSTGAHLHLEVRVDGVRTDPVLWLSQVGAVTLENCTI